MLSRLRPTASIRCAKPLGAKSTIERVAAKLAGKHWIFSGENSRFRRVPPRPPVRTSEDYLREREDKMEGDPR
jgi:hypothetical protein